MQAMGGDIKSAKKIVKSMKDKTAYQNNPDAAKSRSRERYELDPEEAKQKSQINYEQNAEKIREERRRRYQNDPQKEKDYDKDFYQNNKERIREERRRRYLNDPQKEKDYDKDAYQNNEERIREGRMLRYEQDAEKEKEQRMLRYAKDAENEKEQRRKRYQNDPEPDKRRARHGHFSKSGIYGPSFSCLVCHELHWRPNTTVVTLDGIEQRFIDKAYIQRNRSLFLKVGDYHCCNRCKGKTDRGEMPNIAAKNNLECPWVNMTTELLKFNDVRNVYISPKCIIK